MNKWRNEKKTKKQINDKKTDSQWEQKTKIN